MAGSQWERQGTDDTVAAKLFTLPTIKMRSTTGMIDQSDDGDHDKGVEDDDNDTDDTLAAKQFTLPTIKMVTVMMVIKITMM